jgi:hypothetical protein
MAPVTNTYYSNESYKRMEQKNHPKMFEAPPARTGNILTSNTWTSSAVKQIPDFVAGSAMVPEGSFAIGNAARSAVPMETALKMESNALRAQLNEQTVDKEYGQDGHVAGPNQGSREY